MNSIFPTARPLLSQGGLSFGDGADASAPFVLISKQDCLIGLGVADRLPPVPRDRVAALLPGFFAEAAARGDGAQGDGPGLLVGAIPFDADKPVHLFQPRRVERNPARLDGAFGPADEPESSTPVRRGSGWRLRAEPAPEIYAGHVAAALEAMAGDEPALRKVVLARSLLLDTDAPLDVVRLLKILQTDASATTYAVPLPVTPGGVSRTLVGATPELLVEKAGPRVRSFPLAGSARRQPHATADRAAAEALAQSDKDRREHAAVVEAILDALTPYCRTLTADGPELTSTATMWHLATRIEGVLKDEGVSSLELAGVLHPTPAVCGLPRDPARALIGRLEPVDRGFFTGAVGWCDGRGDGRWYVAIRCAEIAGHRARLYAGAGIVPGSLPQAEVAETDAKFMTMLNALQLGDDVITVAGAAR